MVPILVRDSRRLADAQRCRAGAAPSRLALMRASTSGVLDRALDVAAALEVRGYGAAAGRRGWAAGAPLSRHDLAFGASAIAIVAIAALAHWGVAGAVQRLPLAARARRRRGAGRRRRSARVALAPFLDRRGV